MKMNKTTKIIVPVLAMAMGAALVGSVSSTLAWFQYSTKAQASFVGATVYEAENLEIKASVSTDQEESWKSNLTREDVKHLAGVTTNNPKKFVPITTGAFAATDSLNGVNSFYNSVEKGIAGVDTYGGRHAKEENFIQFDLYIRYKRTGASTEYLAKQLNLVDLTITDAANTDNGQLDLYKAVRVQFSTGSATTDTNMLFASNKDSGAGETITTDTYGQLDLDGEDGPDTALVYDWQTSATPIIYGEENSTQVAYNADYRGTAQSPVAFSKTLGNLTTDSANPFKVTVTIWIEGWQKLGYKHGSTAPEALESASASWDKDVYAGKDFMVGMRFQADDIA